MINILLPIYSIYAWFICALAFSSHMVIVLALSPFVNEQISFSIRCTRPIIRTAMFLVGIRVVVENQHHIPQNQSFIIVSNHQSHVDILAYLLAIPQDFSFVAKKELLSVPVVGWDIRSQGHIAIDRKNPRQARKILHRLVTKIRTNTQNLVIFAEGTRSATGELGEFKLGAFDLASKSGAPIVPAGISGSFKVLRKNSLLMRPGKITIRFSAPILAPKSNELHDLEAARTQVVGEISTLISPLS